MSDKPAPDGSELCSHCGLCCVGFVFENVHLDENEVEQARRMHLPVVTEGGKAWFRQPCPQHRDARCGVYELRPRSCRAFECLTLRGYLAGDVDLPAAVARIERLRAAASRVAEQLPEDLAGLAVWEAANLLTQRGEQAPDHAAWHAQHGDLLLSILELEIVVRRDFVARGPRF